MIWGALIGAGVGLATGFLQKKHQKKERRRQNAFAGQVRESRLKGSQSRINQAQKGLKAQLKGFDKAETRISSSERTAKRRALDRQKEIAATLATRFSGTQTTAYQNALGGLSSQVTRELQDVDAAFSQQLANLAIGRGQTEAQGRNVIGQATAAQGNIHADYYNALGGISSQFRTDPYDIFGGAMAGASAGASAQNLYEQYR